MKPREQRRKADLESRARVNKLTGNESGKVWVFFYGTFMDPAELKRKGIECGEAIFARLDGYDLEIRPRANIKKRPGGATYGRLVLLSHEEIGRLYDELKSKFGMTYRPFPVTVKLNDDSGASTLCYISVSHQEKAADKCYVEELAECAKRAGAPSQYIAHIRSFAV